MMLVLKAAIVRNVQSFGEDKVSARTKFRQGQSLGEDKEVDDEIEFCCY